MSIIEIINRHDKKFKYQMLSRLEMDCQYYIGAGNYCSKHLWAGSEEDQISDMLALYYSFDRDDRPLWLTAGQIIDYGKQMGVSVTRSEHNADAILKNAELQRSEMMSEMCFNV